MWEARSVAPVGTWDVPDGIKIGATERPSHIKTGPQSLAELTCRRPKIPFLRSENR